MLLCFPLNFFGLSRRLYLLISHISAQESESCQKEKKKEGNLLLLSCPWFLPFSLSSAPHGEVKLSRRLSRLPRSLHGNHTGRGVWEVAVTGCARTSVYWHSSPYVTIPSNQKTCSCVWIWRLAPGAAYYTFIIALDKIVAAPTQVIYAPYPSR